MLPIMLPDALPIMLPDAPPELMLPSLTVAALSACAACPRRLALSSPTPIEETNKKNK
jgi:hypothetical protein